jgi:hypothetical protein
LGERPPDSQGGPGCAGAVTHYPVTTSYWRGIRTWPNHWGQLRTVRRACDWRRARTPPDVKVFSLLPSCEDCEAYRVALHRLRPWRPVG